MSRGAKSVIILGMLANLATACTDRGPDRAVTSPSAAESVGTPSAPAGSPGRLTGLPLGGYRLADIRKISDDARSLLDLDADGRLAAAFGQDSADRVVIGVLDLSGGSFRRLARADHSSVGAQFSRDGKRILFFLGRELRTIEVASGRVSVVAKDVDPRTPVRWLDDGRIAYLDRSRRLLFTQSGKPSTDSGFRAKNPSGEDRLAQSVSVSPDGSRVLHAEECGVVLTDLKTLKGTRLGRGLDVPLGAWSPTGKRFVVQEVEWGGDCLEHAGALVYDVLFDATGKRIGDITGEEDDLSHGHSVEWSRDERWLLLSIQPTGTSVTGRQYLRVVSLADMRIATVLQDRLMSALAGRGDRIVYARFRRADASDVGDFSGTISIARLTTS